MIVKQYITNEIRECVKRIAENGKIGTSKYFHGIKAIDEAHLTALLLQAIPPLELPHITSLDVHNGLTTLIARFIDKSDGYSASELANYISYLYIDFFKDTIRQLIEDALHEE